MQQIVKFALQRIEGCAPCWCQKTLLTGLNVDATLTGLREPVVARLHAHVFSPKVFGPQLTKAYLSRAALNYLWIRQQGD